MDIHVELREIWWKLVLWIRNFLYKNPINTSNFIKRVNLRWKHVRFIYTVVPRWAIIIKPIDLLFFFLNMLIKRSLHKLLHTTFIGPIKSPLSNPSPSWANKFPVFDGSTPKVPFHGNLRVVHSSSLKMPSDAELAQWMTLSFRYISESLIRLLEINVHIVYRYTNISTSCFTLR